MFHKKFGPDRFSRFDVSGYKQTDKPNLYIDKEENKAEKQRYF